MQVKGAGYSFTYINYSYKPGYRLLSIVFDYNSSNSGNYRITSFQYDDSKQVYVIFLDKTLQTGAYINAQTLWVKNS